MRDGQREAQVRGGARITAAELVSAAKPWGVWISVSFLPMVWMIRRPPR
ncbi:hypothetical protein [Amycolatopsis sulphurea]